jgi:glycosyltransferase involved in cell wall biosynthesis
LFPPGDVAALTQAIVALFQDPATRLAMGQAGRKRACEVFDLENTMNRLEQIYHRALGTSQSA